LGHNYIGTEHLLLGLFGDEDSIAGKVLRDLGASYDVVRDRTLELLAGYGKD
jgi:ATP-dependent Clp protease ATP-binding subunit ClpC